MLPPELQPRSYRPHISPSMSAPNFPTTFNSGYSPERNPSPIYTNGSTSRSLKNSCFSPSSFIHNARIAVALVPCAVFLLDLDGTLVVAILTLGLMIAYILDSLNLKSQIAAQITFFFSSSLFLTFNSIPLGFLACLVYILANFLISVWASLQFKWYE